jgi:WD40 repeat protein
MDVVQKSRFEDLASTDFNRILSFLDTRDLVQCERVCSNFQVYAASEDIWLGLFRERYPHLDPSVLFQFNDRQASRTYKQLVSSFFESRQSWLHLTPFRSVEMGHYDPSPFDDTESHRRGGKTSRVGFNKVISLSQHGNMVAVGTQKDGLRILRDVNGALLRSLEGPKFPCSFTHFIPDASLFVGLSDNGVMHGWSLKGKTSTIFEDPVHTRPPHAFYGGRKWIVSGGLDRKLGVWRVSDIQNGTRFARMDVLGSEIECIDMDEKNGIILCGGFNNAVACSVLPSEVCDEREWAPDLPYVIDIHIRHSFIGCKIISSTLRLPLPPKMMRIDVKDGQRCINMWFVCSLGDGYRMENPSPEGVVTTHLIGHRSKVNVVRFYNSPSTFFSASNDKSVRLWDLHSMTTIQEYIGHRNAVSCVGFSAQPLGTVLVTGSLGKLMHSFSLLSMASCSWSQSRHPSCSRMKCR